MADSGRFTASLRVFGLLLFAAAVWTVVSAMAAGGDPWPVLGILGTLGGALMIGALVARWHRVIVAFAVLLGAMAILAADPADAFGRGALTGSLFHYTNAKACFFALAATASAMVAVDVKALGLRWLAVLAAAVFVLVPVASRSSAAAGLVLTLVPTALVATALRGRLRFISACRALILVVLAATVVLGLLHQPGERGPGVERLAERALSARRTALWHDALALMARRPVFGVGPGRFQFESPVALSDRDARWAHNEFLQQGAEDGIPGLALAVGLVIWLLASLQEGDGFVALAAAAITLVAINASIDYVLHFPLIPLTMGLLAGSALPGRRAGHRVSTDHFQVADGYDRARP